MSSGRVLNRFSKDIGFLDDLLPYHYIDFSVVSSFVSFFVFLFEFEFVICA